MSSCSHSGSATHKENFVIKDKIFSSLMLKECLIWLIPVYKKFFKEKVMKDFGSEEVTVKSGLEAAASIDLLKLFDAMRSEEIGKRAHNGTTLFKD